MDEITKEFLTEQYTILGKSFVEIAKELGTYPNKLLRLARKYEITVKDRSQAQADYIKKKGAAPFEGRKHSEESKIQISEKQAKHWKDMSLEERQNMSDVGKKHWEGLTEEQKELMRKRAFEAVKTASKEGSKLEKYIYNNLEEAGYNVLKHQQHLIANQRVHIDLLLPDLAIAIEIDGPSHFEPIWGTKQFSRAQKTDTTKTSLMLGAGYCMIRVIQHKPLSDKFKRDVWQALVDTIKAIAMNFPGVGDRNITIKLED